MAWLLREGEVLAGLEVCDTFPARMRGLLGRDAIDGAMLLRPARAVHTFRMRFPVDVAFVDADLVVLRTVTMAPNRLGRPVWRARGVLETEAGAFGRWNLRVGDQLEVKS